MFYQNLFGKNMSFYQNLFGENMSFYQNLFGENMSFYQNLCCKSVVSNVIKGLNFPVS